MRVHLAIEGRLHEVECLHEVDRDVAISYLLRVALILVVLLDPFY